MPETDLYALSASWVPVLLAHAALYSRDADIGVAALMDADNPLSAIPSDITLGFFLAIDCLCVWSEIGPDDLEEIAQQFVRSVLDVSDLPPTNESEKV